MHQLYGRTFPFAVLSLVAALVIGYDQTHTLATTLKDKNPGQGVPVKVLRVGEEIGKGAVSGMGSISCPRTLELGFDDTGVVGQILVDEGDLVQEGDILAKLDSSVLEAEKGATEAKLLSAQAEMNFCQNELAKKESLFSKNAISDTELKKTALELEKAKASLEYTRAEIRTLETRIRRKILNAPISAIVSQRHVEVGSVIMPGSNKVVSLIQCRKAFAEIELGEKLFSTVKPGMSAKIWVDALGGRAFEGKLIRIAPQIDKKNRTFILKLEIDNADWTLRPGMFVRADISLSKGQEPVWIPQKALAGSSSTSPSFVFVVKDGVALKREVQVGAKSGNKVEILKGLTKGDLVVIDGLNRIADLEDVNIEIVEDASVGQ